MEEDLTILLLMHISLTRAHLFNRIVYDVYKDLKTMNVESHSTPLDV